MASKAKKTIIAADLFCGAGGTSYGFTRAALKRGLTPKLLAINHWKVAVQSHQENLDYAEHLCMSLDHINPRDAVPGGHLDLLMASPECTHHANAAGGRPKNEQSRATAWHVIKWIQELDVDALLVENVPEFMGWGRLTKQGKVDKRYKGETFLAWIQVIRSNGYFCEYKTINCADYGDATTRKRLFIQAKKKHLGPITWPEPTHASDKENNRTPDLFAAPKKRWKSAREIIDWNKKGKSIFGRKKPHSQKTLMRIVAGLKKFCGDAANPFLLMLYGTGLVRDVDLPLPTVTAGGQHIALCIPELQPFVLGQQSGSVPRSTDQPIPTVATSGAISLIEPQLQPFIIGCGGPTRGGEPRGVSAPINTILTRATKALVEPFIIPIDQQGGGNSGATATSEPISTVTTKARHALIQPEVTPFLVHSGGPKVGEQSVSQPLNTILTREHMALVEPVLVPVETEPSIGKPFLVTVGGPEGQGRKPKSVDEPLPTILTENHTAVVQPFLMAINHKDKTELGQRCYSPDSPLGTLTTKGSFAVIEPKAELIQHLDPKDRIGIVSVNNQLYKLDIRLRMLEPYELAAAHSMAGYIFQGSRADQVRQVGNSVPSSVAEALTGSILNHFCDDVDETVDIAAALNWLSRKAPVRTTKTKASKKKVAVAKAA